MRNINNGRKLGIWSTFDRVEPGKKVLWELNMGDECDLLLYDKDVPVEKIKKDIETYYKKTIIELEWSLRALTPDEVYSTYLSG